MNTNNLEQKTFKYWHLSKMWNGKIEDSIPTYLGIDYCNNIIENTNPSRPLVKYTKNLMQEIIVGNPEVCEQTKVI